MHVNIDFYEYNLETGSWKYAHKMKEHWKSNVIRNMVRFLKNAMQLLFSKKIAQNGLQNGQEIIVV